MAKLDDFFKTTGFRNPNDRSKNPFEYAFGLEKFIWLANNPEYQSIFNRYLTGRRIGKRNWLDIYPVKEYLIEGDTDNENSVFYVDIGGGYGHDLKQLNGRFPSLPGKLVLQDLPEIVWTVEEKLRATSRKPFEAMAHDFFTPKPIKGEH